MKNIKNFINESINEILIVESFKSLIVKDFFEKCKEYKAQRNSTNEIFLYGPSKIYLASKFNDKINVPKNVFFVPGVLEDDDIYNKKIYSGEEAYKLCNGKNIKDVVNVGKNKKLYFIALVETHSNEQQLIYVMFLEKSANNKIIELLNKYKERRNNK